MTAHDTIAALATPPGTGGVAIIRISGRDALAIGTRLSGKTPAPRRATLAALHDADGSLIDQGLLLYFPAKTPSISTATAASPSAKPSSPPSSTPAPVWPNPANTAVAPTRTAKSTLPRPKPLPTSSMPAPPLPSKLPRAHYKVPSPRK